jgi:FixJ family two-component response regulator
MEEEQQFDIFDNGQEAKYAILKTEIELIYNSLSKKEKRVFDLLVEGYPQVEIAKKCSINPKTIYRLKYKIKNKILNA